MNCSTISFAEISAILRRRDFWERMNGEGLYRPHTDVRSFIIDSCLAREDEGEAETLLRDWRSERIRISARRYKVRRRLDESKSAQGGLLNE